jgi:uncharacterized protein
MSDVDILEPTKNEKTLALIAHIGGFLTSFLVPLILYLKADRHTDDPPTFSEIHAREALNFQISLSFHAGLLSIPGIAMIFMMRSIPPWVFLICCLVIVLLGLLFILVETIVVILACVAAHHGKPFRYPLTLRLV